MTRGASLRERAEIAIRGGIITGEIEPGQIYSAPALAKQLGVSATPVREAMLDLASEGLVEPVPNRGFLVVELLERDLDEITELRLFVEVPAVAAVAGKRDVLTKETVERLYALADEMKRQADAAELPDFIEADRLFHAELIELFGNRKVAELVERLRNATRRYGLRRLDRETLVESAEKHYRILDAVVEGDQEKVRRLMEEHVRSNRGILAGSSDGLPTDSTS
jgi:DNA-binding GntR family transcriptional regulator